jgi:glycosyltransferase involved in cell wall biosynthesis
VKKKLLYVITRGEIGGAQKHVADLIGDLRHDFSIAAAIGGGGYLPQSLQALGVPVYELRHMAHSISPAADARAIRELLAVMRAYQPELVHVHSSKAGLLGRIAASIARLPSVYTVHGWAFTHGAPLSRKAIGLLSEAACAHLGDRIVTVSEYDRALCLAYHMTVPDKVVTIRNGVADSPLRALPGTAAEPVVSMVARFDAPKDHPTLLRAVAGIPEPYRVRLVGDGPERGRMRQEAEALGIGGKVDFLGTRTEVAELLGTSHIFVLASRWEGLPLCILEAMRAGLPVIASDVGGVAEAVVDGVTGFLVRSGSPEALRERLRILLANPGLRVRMGAEGRRQYLAGFTLESMLAKTRGLYREVLDRSGAH